MSALTKLSNGMTLTLLALGAFALGFIVVFAVIAMFIVMPGLGDWDLAKIGGIVGGLLNLYVAAKRE